MENLVNLIDQPNWKILLFDVVKQNDFDIWNVDIILLTDLYLAKIKELKEENLLVPANALLAAAILLRLKAYSLKLTSVDDEPLRIPTDDDIYNLNAISFSNPIKLREGQVSLNELIDIVDTIMNRPTKSNLSRQLKEKGEAVFMLPRKSIDITERTDRLFSILKDEIDSEGCLVFSKLQERTKDPFEIIEFYFMPLLFLSQDKKINVWQDDFFSEIFIKIL